MGWKLDIKSAVLGGVVVAVATLVLGAGKAEPTVGRYQASSAGSGTGLVHAFVVDTMTGQVWRTSAQRAQDDQEFFGPKIEGPK